MKITLPIVLAAGMLVGCSFDHTWNTNLPYPLAENPPREYQDKLQAVAHWNVLAGNEAEEISTFLGANKSISFEERLAETDFNLAYKKLLTSHLIDQGVRILGDSGDYLLKFETQIVDHSNRDELPRPAGLLTAGTGATLLAVALSKPAVVAVPLAYVQDWFLHNSKEGKAPDTEVLITTELYRSNEVVDSSTRIYYFNQGNEALYQAPPPVPDINPLKSFQVTDQI